jgi:hypothetical protein
VGGGDFACAVALQADCGDGLCFSNEQLIARQSQLQDGQEGEVYKSKLNLLGELVVARDVGSIDTHNNIADRHLDSQSAVRQCANSSPKSNGFT